MRIKYSGRDDSGADVWAWNTSDYSYELAAIGRVNKRGSLAAAGNRLAAVTGQTGCSAGAIFQSLAPEGYGAVWGT